MINVFRVAFRVASFRNISVLYSPFFSELQEERAGILLSGLNHFPTRPTA